MESTEHPLPNRWLCQTNPVPAEPKNQLCVTAAKRVASSAVLLDLPRQSRARRQRQQYTILLFAAAVYFRNVSADPGDGQPHARRAGWLELHPCDADGSRSLVRSLAMGSAIASGKSSP